MQKKLIYILNHYSKKSEQHFYHIINLLFEMANAGVLITLVVEKSDDDLIIDHPNINVIIQKKNGKLSRPLELKSILSALVKQGYHKVFIRISSFATLVAIGVSLSKKLEVYYWHSGTVKEVNEQQPFGKKKLANYFKSVLPFTLIKRFTTWFVTGPESMKDYYVSEWGVDPDKVIVLYNDIDLKRFKTYGQSEKDELKLKLGLNINQKVILFVHRLSPVRKSLYYMPYVLEVFYKTVSSDYVTVLIGDGSEKSELLTMLNAADLNAKVKVLGGVPNSVIQDYYNIANIFINPTYTEGFPRVLIEAMATGLPVVTTDAGGIKDILGEKQRQYMVSKNDRDAFAQKLIKLALDVDQQQELILENLEQVKRYGTEVVAQMYINKIFN